MTEAHYLVRHKTSYTYGEAALQSHNLSCLRPRAFPGQEVEDCRLGIDPEPDWRLAWEDVYGNGRESFTLSRSHNHLQVTLFARIRRTVDEPKACPLTWEQCVLPDGDAWKGESPLDREFRFASPLLPALPKPGIDAGDCFAPGRPVLEALDAYMARVHATFSYNPKATTTFTPIDEVFRKKAGVCQDFAHAAIADLRHRGFSVGYVSGYLETRPPAGREKLRGADATHAWYAVRIPTLGWIHYDPTNNTRAGTGHVITAWGRDYGDVAPLKGVLLGGGEHEIKVEVDVWAWPDQVPADIRGTL